LTKEKSPIKLAKRNQTKLWHCR